MVDTSNYLIIGGYKATSNWGTPPCAILILWDQYTFTNYVCVRVSQGTAPGFDPVDLVNG